MASNVLRKAWILALVLAAGTAMVGCSGSDGGGTTDVVAEGGETGPSDLTITEDVTTTGDVTTTEDVTTSACSPACDAAKSQYCDETAGQCATVACTVCWRDKDCTGGATCHDFKNADGTTASACSKACTKDTDCTAGWACDATAKACAPKVACPAVCGTGALGDACKKGGVNGACGDCTSGLTCMGVSPSASATLSLSASHSSAKTSSHAKNF